jgi:hypothetical protein
VLKPTKEGSAYREKKSSSNETLTGGNNETRKSGSVRNHNILRSEHGGNAAAVGFRCAVAAAFLLSGSL